MSTISPNFFNASQLRTIREAVLESSPDEAEAGQSSLFKSDDNLQDVLVVGPDFSVFKSENRLSNTLQDQGVKINEDFAELGVSARATPEQLERLKASGYQVFDNSVQPMWGVPGTGPKTPAPNTPPKVQPLEWMGLDKVHSAGLSGQGQTVAVLDSGFQHPEFRLEGWKDVSNNHSEPIDRVGHGTQVVHKVLQAAPQAKILAVKVMSDDGHGRPSDILAGLKYVLEQHTQGKHDVDVINLSLGLGPDGLPDVEHPINKAIKVATDLGITVVAAAGNAGPTEKSIGSPADGEYAITVGAARDPQTISAFSSRGPTEDGLLKPDVIAPGEFLPGWSVPGSEMEQTAKAMDALRQMGPRALKEMLEEKPELVRSLGLSSEVLDLPAELLARTVKGGLPPLYILGPGLMAVPGTSFAAPLVAGTLAALEQERDVTPEAAMGLLRETARPTGAGATVEGKGFVDAFAALQQLRSVPA